MQTDYICYREQQEAQCTFRESPMLQRHGRYHCLHLVNITDESVLQRNHKEKDLQKSTCCIMEVVKFSFFMASLNHYKGVTLPLCRHRVNAHGMSFVLSHAVICVCYFLKRERKKETKKRTEREEKREKIRNKLKKSTKHKENTTGRQQLKRKKRSKMYSHRAISCVCETV